MLAETRLMRSCLVSMGGADGMFLAQTLQQTDLVDRLGQYLETAHHGTEVTRGEQPTNNAAAAHSAATPRLLVLGPTRQVSR